MLRPGDPDPAYLLQLAERIRLAPDSSEAEEMRWLTASGMDEARALRSIARSRLGLCDPNSPVVLRTNPSHYLLRDARHTCALATLAAKRGEAWVEPSLARSSFLLTCAGLEGFINAVYENSESPGTEYLLRQPPRDKWLRAAPACLPHGGRLWSHRKLVYTPGDMVETFDANAEPFVSFSELWTIRNGMMHSHGIHCIVTIEQANAGASNPEVYPVTRIPKEVEHFRATHARQALRIAWAMIDGLDCFMKRNLAMLRGGAQTVEVFV